MENSPQIKISAMKTRWYSDTMAGSTANAIAREMMPAHGLRASFV